MVIAELSGSGSTVTAAEHKVMSEDIRVTESTADGD